jgi:hypothetical protein
MVADSGDNRLGLPPLGPDYAGDAVLYANHLHNANPAKGALVGCTPLAGFLKRGVPLSVFRRFGCRMWVHNPGRPHTHRHKLEPRGVPGRLIGFQGPFVSGVYRVLLSDGKVMHSQTVVFDDTEGVHLPVLPPAGPAPAAESGAGEDSDSDDDADVTAAPPPASAEPLPADNAVAPAASVR